MQVGAALADVRFPGFVCDDEGENISGKNPSYCELTAQYWAWKNLDADYYGFFHYRRYLYPGETEKRPYCIEPAPSEACLRRLGYDHFEECIAGYDVVAPIGENMHISVREHYAAARFHHAEDLSLAEEIVKRRNPEMGKALESYLSGTVCYFGNIYIMKRPVFQSYCAWLFPILEEFDSRCDRTGYSAQERRVNGYLAERLFGVWLTYVRSTLRVLELPRVHFIPDPYKRARQKMLNALLPPGSLVRSKVKAAKKG